MEQKTTQFKRSVKGTLSAGVSSLMGGEGKKYYIIEFKFDSNTHHQGEEKPILVDEAFIGRDPKCQIHIDEEFGTVSREHAIIKKNGEIYTLIHRSQTNATYVNGQQVNGEMQLHNGDEIQLSAGGPRLGFIVPQGEKAFVKSIGMSQRFSEFRKQALRPYRTALVLILLFLVLAIGGLLWYMSETNRNYEDQLAAQQELIDEQNSTIGKLGERISNLFRGRNSKKSKTGASESGIEENVSAELSSFEDYVYFIRLASISITAEPGSESESYVEEVGDGRTWTYNFTEDETAVATGFITSDGYFVTARHVIEPWAYVESVDLNEFMFWAAYLTAPGMGGTIDATYHIESKTGDRRVLTFREFTVSKHRDEDVNLTSTDNDPYKIRRAMAKNDYAYVRLPMKSNLVVNKSLSTRIPAGTRLELLGFPYAMGGDKNYIRPQYTYVTTSNNGLYHGQIPVTNSNLEYGNSGGPVFCEQDGKYYVVGIVSRGLGKHSGVIVPMSQIDF